MAKATTVLKQQGTTRLACAITLISIIEQRAKFQLKLITSGLTPCDR
jgi:hypothetical protein